MELAAAWFNCLLEISFPLSIWVAADVLAVAFRVQTGTVRPAPGMSAEVAEVLLLMVWAIAASAMSGAITMQVKAIEPGDGSDDLSGAVIE